MYLPNHCISKPVLKVISETQEKSFNISLYNTMALRYLIVAGSQFCKSPQKNKKVNIWAK